MSTWASPPGKVADQGVTHWVKGVEGHGEEPQGVSAIEVWSQDLVTTTPGGKALLGRHDGKEEDTHTKAHHEHPHQSDANVEQETRNQQNCFDHCVTSKSQLIAAKASAATHRQQCQG